MGLNNLEKVYKKFKQRYTKIPKETFRLKGERCYNQRSSPSLMKSAFNKKQLIRNRLFNRFSRTCSNQRKKAKNKASEKSAENHLTKSFENLKTNHRDQFHLKFDLKISEQNEIKQQTFINKHTEEKTAIDIQTWGTIEDKNTKNVHFKSQGQDDKLMKLKQRVMSVDTEYRERLVNDLKEGIESVKTQLGNSMENIEKTRPAFGKSFKSPDELNIPRNPNNLIQDLYNQRNFKVRSANIDVYNVTDNTEVEHPESVEGISWSWFREEKYRLLSFVRYPLTAVKSAVLLAEDGFVYTGKGEAMDDAVTCYFCCVQRNRWKTNDVISDIHREISPNCSMITKINCENIPLRTSRHDSQNLDEILNQLNSTSYNELGRHSIQENADKGHEKQGHTNPYSGDIDADSENVSIQNDSTFHRPTTTRGNTSEDMRRGQLMTNMSTFANLLTTQISTPTTGQRKTDPSNIAVQATSSSGSVTQNVASVPSSPQITLPHMCTAPRNTETNNVTNTSISGHTSMVQAEQPSVAIASSVPTSSNSATISQTNVAIASSVPPTSNSAMASQPSVAIASSIPDTPNIATVSQTIANNGEKKSGKGPSYAELGIITERPKRPEYAVKETRKNTFDHWPAHHHLTPEDLSDAGFYYAGYGDCARCFYCGGGLRNWEDEDDVWVEHARWFPKCAYIRQQMGQVFVDTVQELNKTLDVISFEKVKESCKAPTTTSSLDAKLEPLKRDPAVLTVVDIGYSLTDVLQVAKIIKGKDVILSSDALLTKLQELKKTRTVKTLPPPPPVRDARSSTVSNDEEAIRQLKERNNQLREQTVCKICMDKEVAVVFLPCGHLVSCAECASAMKDCPVCRVTVKGVVRAFI